jgi:ferredoxin-type protein NapH
VQAGFLLAWLDPFLLRMHGVCSPVFHCYSCPWATFACPIGILAQFSALHVIPYLAAGILLVTGSLFGSLVCGWACPFGFLQDLVARIPIPKLCLPGWLGLTRYAVLAGLVILVPYYYGDDNPWFICRLCPAGALEAAVPYSIQQSIANHAVYWPSVNKQVILAVFVLSMLVLRRPWCTLLCPLGAIFGLCNYVSVVFLRFQPHRCNDCELCRDLCKYRGPSERRGSDLRCIRCFECTRCQALSVKTIFTREDTTPPEGVLPIIELPSSRNPQDG